MPRQTWHLSEGAELIVDDMSDTKIEIDAAVAATLGMYEIKPPITVFGRACHQQRNVCFVSSESAGYAYSNQVMRSKLPKPEHVRLLQIVNEKYKPAKPFNGILINQYPDGNHYIGAHSDDERGVDVSAGVLAISHGAIRKFRVVRKKKTKTDNPVVVPTHPYHAIQMKGPNFQRDYTHEIPIEKKVSEMRTSITFRYHDPALEKKMFASRGIEWYLPQNRTEETEMSGPSPKRARKGA